MIPSRLVAAWACAAAIILSAPFVQQLFVEVTARWPEQARALGVAATVVPAGIVLVLAIRRIRDRRLLRYALLMVGLGASVAYILGTGLTFTEAFHFAEYGVLALLFYRAWRPSADWTLFALPLVAGVIAGSLDEFFQWFIPIRAGEARDVLINVVATACGLLAAVAIDPPASVRLTLDRASRRHVLAWSASALVVFALFFQTVHVGHAVIDPEIGSFRSRYTAGELAAAARDRAERWRDRPPVAQRRLGREDHYLTEALWHVQRRNQAWDAGDAAAAWRENQILETFYAPALDTATYVSPGGHRWPAAQRDEAALRAGAAGSRPYASDAYAYPLYVWSSPF